MKTPIIEADKLLAIQLVRLYIKMEAEGRLGQSSLETAIQIQQAIAEFREEQVQKAKIQSII